MRRLCAAAGKAGLREQVMVDVSHANSSKQHRRQIEVAADVAAQVGAGERRIMGVMIESHLNEGRQDIVPGQPLQAGVSVTDACISFEQTLPVLEGLAEAVRARRGRRLNADGLALARRAHRQPGLAGRGRARRLHLGRARRLLEDGRLQFRRRERHQRGRHERGDCWRKA